MSENLLHTDSLEQRYGTVTALVREHTKDRRVIDIVDRQGISRTHAITWFPQDTNNGIDDIRREVAEGALLGKTFRQHGFSVEKPALIEGEIPLPDWLQTRFRTQEESAHVLVYEFWGVRGEQRALYGVVAEIYSPDFMPPSRDDQYLYETTHEGVIDTRQISELFFSYLNNGNSDRNEDNQNRLTKKRDALYPIPPFTHLPEDWQAIPAVEKGEPLVCLNDYLTPDSRVLLSPVYYQEGLKNSSSRMYSRSRVAEALIQAAVLLPDGYKLIVYDAYRSPETQQALYEREYANMRAKNPDLSAEELDALAQQYVALPSWDKDFPSPHGSGGAVDVSIVKPNGTPLDMGTTFDSLDESSHTAYFLHSTDSTEMSYHENRQLLYDIMLQAGFTNYPSEWWHFDMGNRVSAAIRGEPTAPYGLPNPIE